MNINSNTYTATFPWGPGTKVPAESLADEAKVRTFVADTTSIAESHISGQNKGYVGNGYSKDLDPSPTRVLRTRKVEGQEFVLEINATDADEKGAQQPLDLTYRSTGGELNDQRAVWQNGEMVSFSLKTETEIGLTQRSFQVNDNGTLTYTEISPGPPVSTSNS